MRAVALAALAISGCGGSGESVTRYELESELAGRKLEQVLVEPEGEPSLLVVLLHGRGGGAHDLLNEGALAEALDALGDRAPAVLLPAGGRSSYWHDRRDGRWGSYVLQEAVPAALDRLEGAAPRVAIGGVSMGGFGALDLARLAPGRFCAVGGHSPALWRTGGDTPAGAFDDAEAFERHDLLGAARRRPGLYGPTPVWLDVGEHDSFREATEALAASLSDAELHVWPGDHSLAYTRRHLSEYLAFYVDACRSA
jgi:S-formylglutathione hydrolase FrmB